MNFRAPKYDFVFLRPFGNMEKAKITYHTPNEYGVCAAVAQKGARTFFSKSCWKYKSDTKKFLLGNPNSAQSSYHQSVSTFQK
jgi:hypothetical protein